MITLASPGTLAVAQQQLRTYSTPLGWRLVLFTLLVFIFAVGVFWLTVVEGIMKDIYGNGLLWILVSLACNASRVRP